MYYFQGNPDKRGPLHNNNHTRQQFGIYTCTSHEIRVREGLSSTTIPNSVQVLQACAQVCCLLLYTILCDVRVRMYM